MIRKHEKSVSIPAALMAIAVHALMIGVMIFSVNWQAVHAPVSVSDVQLWDEIPAPQAMPLPAPEPEDVIDELEPEPEPAPEIVPEPEEVDIALEQKQKELEKQKAEIEKKKKELERKKKLEAEKEKKRKQKQFEDLQKKLRGEVDSAQQREKERKLKDLQNAVNADVAGSDARQARAAVQGIVNEYTNRIRIKIRGHVNKSLCPDVDKVEFKVNVLPTGDIGGMPRLTKSSNVPGCDDAVGRAIMASQPLPLPSDPVAMAQFRNLNLIIKPNE